MNQVLVMGLMWKDVHWLAWMSWANWSVSMLHGPLYVHSQHEENIQAALNVHKLYCN